MTPGNGFIEEIQRQRAPAVVRAARGAVVLSHITAGALHGLPLIDVWDECVHTTPFGANPPRTHAAVVRHRGNPSARDVTVIEGLLVTSLDRTVFDIIRTTPFSTALAVMDAALHLVAWDPRTRTVDDAPAEAFRALVRGRVVAGAGWRGIRTARLVADIADPRVESAAESRGRARMWENRMPMPELQVRVRTRLGDVWLDYAWPALRRFGECDGEIKLTDPTMLAGRTAEEVRMGQIDRRAAVVEATGWVGMNWGWPETADAGTFWQTVIAQGWDESWRLEEPGGGRGAGLGRSPA